MYKNFLVKHLNKIVIVFLLILNFIFQRNNVPEDKTLIGAFRLEYNERRFLAIYVGIFLIALFPVLKKIFKAEYVTRLSEKWRVCELLWKEVAVISLLYAFLISFGWYMIVGLSIPNGLNRNYLLYMFFTFIKLFIGWFEIGIIEAFIYILIHNLLLAFISCDAFLILMNLSLYIGSNEQVLQYTRVFDFMFNASDNIGLYRSISVGMFHIVIICLLILASYEIIKRHDYLMGGKRKYAD